VGALETHKAALSASKHRDSLKRSVLILEHAVTFPVAAASRQRIARASLEKAPKVGGMYLLARPQRLLLAVWRMLRLTGFKGAGLGRATR
jgi:hypothetical protein